MRPARQAVTGALIAALSVAIGVGPTASATVPVPTDNAFVVPGATVDGWAPAVLAPLDPWGIDGVLLPHINENYYDCAGCTAAIVRYPRTAGPLFGPGAPFADQSIDIAVRLILNDVGDAAGPSVVAGLSLGAIAADAAQRALDADPNRPPPSRLTFIAAGDPSRVTPLSTGIGSFLPSGFRVPVLGWTVTRPPVDSNYDTVVVVGEYDLAADFPDRPWNLLADLNALVGFQYSHSQASLTDPADVPPQYVVTTTNSKGATTTTYLAPSPELPLLKPLHGILPAPVTTALNTVLKPIVDRGYSRYDTVTGNKQPYLQPTDGWPRLVRPTAPAAPSATDNVAVPTTNNSRVSRPNIQSGPAASTPHANSHPRRASR